MEPVNVLSLTQHMDSSSASSARDPEIPRHHHHHHHHHHHLPGVHHFSMENDHHHHHHHHPQFPHFVLRDELDHPHQSLMALAAGGIGVVPQDAGHEDHQVNKLELRWTDQGFCTKSTGEQPGNSMVKEVGRWEPPAGLYERNAVMDGSHHVVEGTHHVVLPGEGSGSRWEDPSLCDGNEDDDLQNDGGGSSEQVDGKRGGGGGSTREVRWTEQALCDALQAVKSGTLTAYKASKDYGIPRSTLRNWLNGRNRSRKRGPRVDEALSFCRQDAVCGGEGGVTASGSMMQMSGSELGVNSGEDGPGSDNELWQQHHQQQKRRHVWTRNTLLDALGAVRSGELSVSRAAQVYGVPNSTLDYWIKEHEKKSTRAAAAVELGSNSSLTAYVQQPQAQLRDDEFGGMPVAMEEEDEEEEEDDEEDEDEDEQMPGSSEKKERLKKKAREGKKRVGGWTEKALSDAMDAIKSNTLTICKASRAYGIPRTTLRNWITGRTRSRKRGPHTGLPFGDSGATPQEDYQFNDANEEITDELKSREKGGKWPEQALLEAVEAVRGGQQFGAPRPGIMNGASRRKSPNKSERELENSFDAPEPERTKKSNGWTEQALQSALQAIRNGFSIRKAGQHYGIPRTTLRNWLNGRTHSRKRGPHGGMTRGEQESAIVEWFFSIQQVSQSLTTLNSLRRRVSTLSVNKGSPFKDGIPVKKWWVWFNRRHPDVAARVGEGLQEAQNRSLIDELSVVHMVTGEHLQILRRRMESEDPEDEKLQRGEDMDSCSQDEPEPEADDHHPSSIAGEILEQHLVENGMTPNDVMV